MHAPTLARPRLVTLLLTQLIDGFGGGFHAVLLSLYTLRVAGIGGFAGMTAFGMIGIVVSTLAAGWLTDRLGGRRTMRVSACVLAVSRVAAYVLVFFGAGVAPLLVLRLLGSASATLMMNAAKSQVPDGKAASSLAWMNVATGVGQVIAVAVAGVVALGPTWVIAVVGAPMATLPTLSMIRLSRYVTAAATPLRTQLAACRVIVPTAVLLASVQLFVSGMVGLKDGLTVNLYSQSWLGAVAAASLAGSFVAAAMLPRLSRFNAHPRSDLFLWPLLGAFVLGGWAFADSGVEWLLASQFVGGLAGQTLAAFTEARVLEDAGREGAVSALTLTGGATAAAGALSSLAVPPLLAELGFGAAVLVIGAPLLVLASIGGIRLLRRTTLLRRPVVASVPV